jgi:tRNA A-37 threonylcarbamoyl transferase component Bud32
VNQPTRKLAVVTAGGIRWRVVPECRDLLFGPEGLRLNEWLRTGRAEIVKHGPNRTVYRVHLPGLSFHLKHYRLPDVRTWLRELIRPVKARREFAQALAVAARQVPTIAPVGHGRRRAGPGPSESFLITRSLEGAEPLGPFLEETLPGLPPERRDRLRRRLAVALGEFVARLHDAGVVHDDFHAANLLVRLGRDDEPQLHVIDLHAVHLRRELPWPVCRENLVVLGRWFVIRASRADRCRFWQAYCQARFGFAGRVDATRRLTRELARDLEERTWRSNLRFWRHRERRCLNDNRRFKRIDTATMRGHAVRDLCPGALAELLADPDAPFDRPGARLLKDSRSSTVTELTLPVDGVPRAVIYKRFRVTTRLDPWLALVRRTPAVRSWVQGHSLRDRCLPTPRPLAVFHRRRGPFRYEGYLLTEKVPEAVDLHGFVDRLGALPESERRAALRQRIEDVARLVRELHRRQLSHRDLKAGNVLVTATRVWLIDLVGVHCPRKLPHARIVQNLARLNASFLRVPGITRTDKLRFLRIYLAWGLFGRYGWKRWWREVAEATEAKVRHNARTGRPLW